MTQDHLHLKQARSGVRKGETSYGPTRRRCRFVWWFPNGLRCWRGGRLLVLATRRESSARGPLQGLCACCPRAGSAPEVGEEGRCAVAVSLLPCPVARAVARVSWTPGGELRACNWRYSSLRMWGAAFRCHSLAQAARPSRAKRRNTTVALRADPVAIRDLAGAAPFKRCGRRVAGLGMARNPLGWQEGLDCRGL